MYEYNELNRIEKPAIDLFTQLGYTHVNAFHEKTRPLSALRRRNESDVILDQYLRPALKKLNAQALATVPAQANDLLEQAIAEIRRDRSDRPLAEANREIYRLLKEGIQLSLTRITRPIFHSFSGTTP